eukprot:3826772-Prymnesium_polylepis.2
MASYLGTVALDSHVIMLNIITFTFLSFPFALGIAASIRVGHLLGQGDAPGARTTAKATFVLILVSCGGGRLTLDCTVIGGVIVIRPAFSLDFPVLRRLCASLRRAMAGVIFRNYLGVVFTTDERVISTVASLAWVAALFQISDGLQAAVAGVMRGMGRQKTVAWLNFLGFWVIGLSAGATLTFGARMGVYGLWWGFALGLTCVATLGVTILLRIDWAREAAEAQQRVGLPGSTSSDVANGGAAWKEMVELPGGEASMQPDSAPGDAPTREPATAPAVAAAHAA